jgi:hypothetical protein
MDIRTEFHPGFIVYKNGFGPVWVCPHAGPAIEIPNSRDDNSDTVASLCWMRTGGSFIISTLPRDRIFGIDFNRDIPPREEAIELWNDFTENSKKEKIERFRDKYAWVAKDEKDYENRLKIYETFWSTVKKLGNIIVFVHRELTRLGNFPSMMEIITYQGQGVNKEIVKLIVDKINRKYDEFFENVSQHYKYTVLLEEKRVVNISKEGIFTLKTIRPEHVKSILKDLKVMKKYAKKRILDRLKDDFNDTNFLLGVDSTMDNGIVPRVTIESIFKGEKALQMKMPLFLRNNIVMEVEASSFINYWYPDVASTIIIDLLTELISVDMYKKMGAKQTQVLKFVKG